MNQAITPAPDTIESGAYAPFSRPLFIYVSTKSLKRPEVKAFIDFYIDNAELLIPETGYVPLSVAAYDEARAKVATR